ncbi:MAG: class I SAM-dependent methyltransferase [Brevinematales bacterium]|nr:class I SAM-dependent methyltransferase [Brevinematales bacterium]
MNQNLSQKAENYFMGTRPEMIEFVPSECKRVLEVGCGQGAFGAYIKERNKAEVWGAELMDDQAKVAATRLDKVITGDFVQNIKKLPKSYFDCVIFNDSLEHLTDHYLVLQELKKNLIPGGFIAGSIPNFRFYRNIKEILFKKEFQYISAGILDYTHYRFFTKKSIIRTFNECGYEIVNLKGINEDRNKKLKILNFLLFGFLSDMKYVQFGVTAKAI